MGPLRGPGSKGSEGSEGSEGKVLRMDRPRGRRVLKFDGAFGPEGCGGALRAMSIKSALRDWLSASYSMLSILVIGSLRSPPKGETAEWYMKYMTLCFSPQIPRFPLRGTPRRGKGCTGQSTDLTPHRGPDRQSAACVIFASYHWTRLRCEGSKGSEGKVLKIDRPYRPESS